MWSNHLSVFVQVIFLPGDLSFPICERVYLQFLQASRFFDLMVLIKNAFSDYNIKHLGYNLTIRDRVWKEILALQSTSLSAICCSKVYKDLATFSTLTNRQSKCQRPLQHREMWRCQAWIMHWKKLSHSEFLWSKELPLSQVQSSHCPKSKRLSPWP